LEEVIAISLGEEVKREAVTRLTGIRRMIAEQLLPAASEVRSRCEECEFRNNCGDVF
jgi:CRISPR/Cas system-associated exonuclease Cas4 (RecB family)